MMSSRDARSFVSALRKREVGGDNSEQDNATEECCKEGCTYGEVAEYRC